MCKAQASSSPAQLELGFFLAWLSSNGLSQNFFWLSLLGSSWHNFFQAELSQVLAQLELAHVELY
jgi:hypothetical protein